MGAKVTEVVSAQVSSPQVTGQDIIAVNEDSTISVFTPDAPLEVSPVENVSVTEEVTISFPLQIEITGELIAVSEDAGGITHLGIGVSEVIGVNESVSATRINVGTGSNEIPVFVLTSAGLFGSVAEVDLELPITSISSIGLWGGAGTLVGEISASFAIEATGVINEVGTASVELIVPVIDSYGYIGDVATSSNNLPVFLITASGHISGNIGTASIELPMFIVDASGLLSQALAATDDVAMYAMNSQSFGVTEHSAMGATGLCFHKGKLFIANGNGVLVSDGSADDGEAIPVIIARDGIDFGSGHIKALTDAYSYVRSTGTHSVRITARDKNGTGSTSTVHSNPHGSKVNLPRGLRSRVFDITIFANGDNEFELTETELIAEVSQTRRGRQNG